jgi:hypothetical protein
MNSHEGFKGFISFLILSGAIGLSVLSFKYIELSTNLTSIASNEEVMPKLIEVKLLTESTATINWLTDTELVGIIIYSENKKCFEDKKNNYDACTLVSEPKAQKNHTLSIEKLTPATTYYYKIKGYDYIYPEEDVLSFTTTKTIQPIEPIETAPISEESDYEGFETESLQEVLGISTMEESVAHEKISYKLVEEFKEALVFNNLKYDFNKNGQVENTDYPLFIQFIKNTED